MRITIQTPEGPRELPEWAKCYCVSRHTPQYIHPIPFMFPDGSEIFLCPTTHHQVTVLLSAYQKYGGRPAFKEEKEFNYVVKNIGKIWWTLYKQETEQDDSFFEWQTIYDRGIDPDLFNFEAMEMVKKMQAE